MSEQEVRPLMASGRFSKVRQRFVANVASIRTILAKMCIRDRRNAWIPQLPLGSALGSTLGAAVWTDPETAARRAVLELAERDAAGIWWHNRLGITPLPWAQVREFLPKICADWPVSYTHLPLALARSD